MAQHHGSDDDETGQYRIGAVCRMTGLSPHVLRVWEKRYGVVQPERQTNRRRLYSEEDVRKLSLLKTLVDRGQAIGTLAELGPDELERRVEQTAAAESPSLTEKPALILVGETLSVYADACAASDVFDLAGVFTDSPALHDHPFERPPDVAVLEWPTLHAESGTAANRLANRLNIRHLVLVYNYASRSALKLLQGPRITAIRSPLDLTALEAVVGWRLGFRPRGGLDESGGRVPVAPARRFSDRDLACLATQSATVACECPRHLAQLISSLARFEVYSAECESRGQEDAALHSYLYSATSQARSAMENALARVVEMEGLSTEPGAKSP